MIEYRKFIARSDLRREPDKLFVFGDNIVREGLGGQAAEMRGEPNAVGIPTKIYPSMNIESFFSNANYDMFIEDVDVVADFKRLREFKGVIVWPEDGIGTERAQLKQRAPLIWSLIEELRIELEL